MTSAMPSWHAYWRTGRLCPPLSLRSMSRPYGLISERKQCRTPRNPPWLKQPFRLRTVWFSQVAGAGRN